jgi:undecaprenyl-diphosphatase
MSVVAISRQRSNSLPLRLPALPRVPLAAIAFLSSTVFLLLFADTLLHDRAFFDTAGLKAAQRVSFPGQHAIFTVVNALTSSNGAIAGWSSVLAVFAALRWWVPAMAVGVLPFGALANTAIGVMAGRVRPAGDEFDRVTGSAVVSFPSGHVMGAVLLYGLLFAMAGRFENAILRNGLRLFSAAVLLTVGYARLWEGAHWPSDVLGAYSLGFLLLAGILWAYNRADAAWGGLPLIRRGTIAHDEGLPHAHALTSVVLFRGQTVAKVYEPGLLPRVLYFAAYQAPFPYINNRAALEAAVARRNLAGLLSEYWYGERVVARALGVEDIDGRPALAGEFIDGRPAASKDAAKAFLRGLRANFEASGLPTWQIDPRQPRAADNVLEVAPGRYRVVDLESGLVAPIASPKVWLRAIRRGLVPLFDDIHADVTRAYIAREAAAMRERMGERWFAELEATLDAAETAQDAWRAGEPRLIGRFVGGFWSGWNYRAWPARFERVTARGRDKADRGMRHAIDLWASEGRLSPAETAALHAQVESDEIRAVMPHLGAHGVISLFLRFPFGSIARPAWTLGALLVDTGRLALGRIGFAQWKASWTMHSPLVVVLSAIPGFGAFAYLAAKPVRRNRLLVRAVADALGRKVPGRLYERSGLQRIVARPVAKPSALRAVPGSIHREWQVEPETPSRAAA